jgi:acetoacetate decarboxylase
MEATIMPGFVKTDEELDRIAAIFKPWRYVIDEVGVAFRTTWEFARWALPPCLEPVGDRKTNVADAAAGVLSIECPHFGRFESDHIVLMCRYGDQEGTYILQSLHSTEGHVIAGREIWGGPKKLGDARVIHDGDHHYGYSEREGTRLVEIEVETDGHDRAPQNTRSKSFTVKMIPHASGRGLQYPPLLTIWEGETKASSLREGTGTLKWGQSERTAVHTIPIVSVASGSVLKGQFEYQRVVQHEIKDPEGVYARYLWGTYMDDPTSYHIAARWRNEIEVNGEAEDRTRAPVRRRTTAG